VNRREFLRTGIAAAVALPPLTPLLVSCSGGGAGSDRQTSLSGGYEEAYRSAVRQAEAAGPAREVRLVADVGEVEVGPGQVYRTWLYNGEFPGPEIRVREGERLRVTLENRLPEATTIHWHGVPVPNAMDGVPGITQAPVPPGGTFVYDYVAEPSGSYMYHSHVELQIDRGLLGPLVFEERAPHVEYDREYTVVLDDFLPTDPEPMEAGGGMMGRMMGGRGMQEMRDVPDYAAFLVNGRLPSDPAVFEVSRGERVRLRLVNPSGATVFRAALAGHRMRVTHADARPVRPMEVDALLIGPGERYDVVVEADNPGAWTLMAASVNAGQGEAPRRPDRVFDLALSGGMMMSTAWTIDGEAYPDAAPLEIRAGERVRVNMVNHSMAIHPMHLHGHFFRVGNAIKETVMVPPHMGQISYEFVADHPGEWFFHCHNLYHMESGMVRVFRYVG
jgi:FtsP/CotA-like multicopper oxidase with cupredoxin domain